MSICEKKQENSGVPQGTFAKRQRIVRDEGEETFYDLNDLVIGGTLDIYGRTFFITDCNNSTRKYLHDVVGRSEEELHPMPGEEDVYTTMRAEFMSRETGRDDSVAHNIRKNPMKVRLGEGGRRPNPPQQPTLILILTSPSLRSPLLSGLRRSSARKYREQRNPRRLLGVR